MFGKCADKLHIGGTLAPHPMGLYPVSTVVNFLSYPKFTVFNSSLVMKCDQGVVSGMV